MSRLISPFWVAVFFIACLVISGMLLIGLMMMPVDTHAVCDPLINQTRVMVNYYCVCQEGKVVWP